MCVKQLCNGTNSPYNAHMHGMRGTGFYWHCKLFIHSGEMDWSTAKCYGSDQDSYPWPHGHIRRALNNWAISLPLKQMETCFLWKHTHIYIYTPGLRDSLVINHDNNTLWGIRKHIYKISEPTTQPTRCQPTKAAQPSIARDNNNYPVHNLLWAGWLGI